MPALDAAAPAEGQSPVRRVVAVLLLFAGLALVASTDALHEPLLRLIAATERVIADNPVAGAALFVVFAALSGMLAFFSSAVLVPVAVYAFGPFPCVLLLWLGWTLGGALTYFVGRYLGRPVVARLAPRALARYEQVTARDMPVGVVILFQLAMPSEVPGYLLGLARYSFLRYILVVVLGELPFAAATVLLGDSFVQRRVAPFILIGVAGAVFSGWTYARLQRRLRERAQTAQARSTEPASTST